ncbi:hypothetical protein BDB00DRAFT_820417 [Zychaea mexicana]|uniref:uncharacterized protein n=1 Tax=Zychaea mexicana TaxID=64656 RepID=UPI0022FEDB66|nr:uncharacterized protein BDB00DRAFT_820417 [Zychaea mexicana]KAI9494012.1 hypothetical protein BDB00DRAFT_820417 [Zychaea mexicana]
MSNSSRGRGRRQYNDYNNNYDNNSEYDQPAGGSDIFSRLGPRGGGNQGGHNNAFNSGGGKRGGGHRGGHTDAFNSGGGQRGGGGMRSFDNSMSNNNNNYHNNNRQDNYQQPRGRGGFSGGGRFNDNEDDLFSTGPRSQPRGGRSNRGNRGRGRGFDGGHQSRDTQQRWKSNDGRHYTRKFVDEDIAMDTPDAPAMNGQGIVVAVSGHPDGAEEKLLGFLQRKSKQPWHALNVRSEQGIMYITVADEHSATALARLNNYNFGSAVLEIRHVDGGSGGAGQQQRGGPSGGGRSNALEEFLQERWDAPRGFLNLDELPKTRHTITIVISRLLMVAVDLFGNQIMTISFARNGLWSVKPLKKLPELFPGLQNLSIQDNEIADFRSLDEFANKFSTLTELMIVGNPIQTQYDWQQYQSEVTRRFPSVQMLDQQPVGHSVAPPPAFGATGSPAGFGTPPPAPPTNVPETRANFFDQPSSQQATEELLSQYFQFFDSNRAALVDLYDAQSCFSVSVTRSALDAAGTWGQAPRLVIGSENIIQRLAALPPTIHDLTSSESVMVDALQTSVAQNVLLSITIHGHFKEATGANGQVYSFDRVMIVAPAQPGSRAQNAGWRYVILQDSLIIHK